MITFLPDPEIQKAEAEKKRLQPKNKFQFLWDAFFRNRKFKLTPEELKELTDIEKDLQKYHEGYRKILDCRNNTQDVFDREVSRFVADPTDENLVRVMAFTWDNFTHHQLSRAGDAFLGFISDESNRRYPPIVRRHLTRIHDSLVAEYREQEKFDQKSLARLEGIASGGESQACIELRIRAEKIQELLEGGDLASWREVLAPFLP